MEQIAAAKIKVYEFPEVEDGEEAERKENRRMKVGFYHGFHRINGLFQMVIWRYPNSPRPILSQMSFTVDIAHA